MDNRLDELVIGADVHLVSVEKICGAHREFTMPTALPGNLLRLAG
ncbi:MAG: hypothetical protein R2856_02220 [Caldilineaceae bacterium]